MRGICTYIVQTCALVLIVIGACVNTSVFAQVMQSSNYQIQSDSINVGGGYGTSSNYGVESTVGEVATGYSSSTSYGLDAGYQQGAFYLALSGVSDVVMAPDLGGLTGGTSDGATTVTVTTDNYAGYTLTIAASTSPAMQSASANIPDYTPGGASPDYSFSNIANESQFGFSPEGTDITSRYKDNGVDTCNTGSSDTASRCWDGLSTTPATIASRTIANHPSGTATTVRFRVGVGSSAAQAAGTYVATTTITALPN